MSTELFFYANSHNKDAVPGDCEGTAKMRETLKESVISGTLVKKDGQFYTPGGRLVPPVKRVGGFWVDADNMPLQEIPKGRGDVVYESSDGFLYTSEGLPCGYNAVLRSERQQCYEETCSRPARRQLCLQDGTPVTPYRTSSGTVMYQTSSGELFTRDLHRLNQCVQTQTNGPCQTHSFGTLTDDAITISRSTNVPSAPDVRKSVKTSAESDCSQAVPGYNNQQTFMAPCAFIKPMPQAWAKPRCCCEQARILAKSSGTNSSEFSGPEENWLRQRTGRREHRRSRCLKEKCSPDGKMPASDLEDRRSYAEAEPIMQESGFQTSETRMVTASKLDFIKQ